MCACAQQGQIIGSGVAKYVRVCPPLFFLPEIDSPIPHKGSIIMSFIHKILPLSRKRFVSQSFLSELGSN